ncbi:MAG: 4-hydroxy-tetrahydrodipicolinate synthase [Pseudomonadota bacterium]|jgi:4-hydroxy-tetrahydrodipicolinate synthase
MDKYTLDLSGVYTAIITPFSKDSELVDYASLEALIEYQIRGGVAGLVVCGSTGEASTLSGAEYLDVVRFVRERTRGKLPCVCGISVSATSRAVELAKFAEEIGCDGVLLAAPPYNKPTQVGIIEHFRAVHRASSLPIVAYNIPGRSAVTISPHTLGALSQEGVICAIKESTGSVDALADTIACARQDCQVVSGDDSMTLATMAYGGIGAISAGANAMPDEMVGLVRAWQAGNTAEAQRIQMKLLGRLRALFIETNPVPVKTILALKGVIAHPAVRLPLVPLSKASLEKLKAEFQI